jgi:HlyD family secretion protein
LKTAAHPDTFRRRLLAGMPTEVQIETTKCYAISYFIKPITDQFNRAFREE